MARIPVVFLGALLSSIVLAFAGAPQASAISIGLMSGDDSWREQSEWPIMQHSGAKVFRMQMNQSEYNQQDWDNAVRWAAERGIVILPYLYGWAKSSKEYPSMAEWIKPTTEYGSWASWVDFIVQRYGYGGQFWSENPSVPYHPVGAWQVWNEPNLGSNNPEGETAPAAYAQFFVRTAELIRAAQAKKSAISTQVIFAGIYSNGGMGIHTYLKEAKKAPGISAAVDAFAIHPYSFTAGVGGVEAHVNAARKALDELGFESKSLWITELGWNVIPWAESDSAHPPVTIQQQGEYLTGSFNWIRSVSVAKKIPLIVWYIYRDQDGVCGTWHCHAGLRSGGPSGSYRPAWYAFQEQTGAVQVQYPDPAPNSWHQEKLGGVNTSAPDAASTGPGTIQVFAKGADNALWYRKLSGFMWTDWIRLGGYQWSGPGAVSQGSTDTNVMSTNWGTNELSHWFLTGGQWYGPQNLGGVNTSDPDLASWGAGRLDLFVRGSDNSLWTRNWNGLVWSGWQKIGGTLTSGPGAVSWGPGRIDVVYRASDGQRLYHRWYENGTWYCCNDLGGINTSDPDLASRGPGRLDLFVRGSDNAIWHRQFDINNGGWGGWGSLGGSITSAPSAVAWGQDNRVDVFARTAGDKLTHWWWGPED